MEKYYAISMSIEKKARTYHINILKWKQVSHIILMLSFILHLLFKFISCY